MKVPANYIEFLQWVKTETESHWQNMHQTDDEQNNNWIIGAKWLGLEESHIKDIEKKYNVIFTPEHREFLKVLHAIDKKRPVEYYQENDEVFVKHDPYFYNWLSDEEEINRYLNWPYQEILKDIKRGAWFNIWGTRPKSEMETEKVFYNWFSKAPQLIPIHAHRFVVTIPNQRNSPVLSVYGSDTIVYGWNIKHYLLNELTEFLSIHESVYNEEDNSWYDEPILEIKEFKNEMWVLIEDKGIPVWDELINAADPTWKYTPSEL